MPEWATYAGITGVVLMLLILLARASQGLVEPTASEDDDRRSLPAHLDPTSVGSQGVRDDAEGAKPDADESPPSSATDGVTAPDRGSLSSGALLLNVAFTQGLFGAVLAAAAWFSEIPPAALGLADPFDAMLLLAGAVLGVALYAGNEAMAVAAEDVGIEYAEDLREMLAPDSALGWAVLLVVVLPVIAVFEEFLFRASLVGALSVGFGVSPWLLAVVSTLFFAIGHGAQGRAGIVVTGVLGFVLAAAFIVTESFVAVVVAHYLVNALEFLVHEGLDVELSGGSTERG